GPRPAARPGTARGRAPAHPSHAAAATADAGARTRVRHHAPHLFEVRVITALYPGSFDPLTHGHLDIVDRAARIFDRVVIAVLENPNKRPLFTSTARVAMIKESLGDRAGVGLR